MLYHSILVKVVSIHASRAGRDTCTPNATFANLRVSIHASRAGRDVNHLHAVGATKRFNPRVPCGTRRGGDRFRLGRICVSIHASRAGRDLAWRLRIADATGVSIHASRAGRDTVENSDRGSKFKFQSTRPVRDATIDGSKTIPNWRGFNPRVPCGTRLLLQQPWLWMATFQSTRPVRDATGGSFADFDPDAVSIHASRAGRDLGRFFLESIPSAFQSTRPVRDATARSQSSLSTL